MANAARKSTITHRGPVFDVEVIEYTDAAGRAVRRDVARHPGAVTIVPIEADGSFVMVRNERIAVQSALLEFPAGKLEQGEDPALAAARELEEETGRSAGTLEPIGWFYTSPGMSDERMHVFRATNLSRCEQRLEPGEEIEVEVVSRDAFEEALTSGGIVDGKTLSAFLLHERARAETGVTA